MDSGMRQDSILLYLFLCHKRLCKIAVRANDNALNSSCDKAYDLSQQVEISYELQFDLTHRICWKIFPFFISYVLNVKRQSLVLKTNYSSSNIKSCYLELV